MRDVPADLAAALASGVTTLCRCWRVQRRDGAAFGFTDHDRDLSFDGLTFAAATGLDATEAEASLGLAVGGGEVAGALSAAAITEEDVARGFWDGAQVETWLVDWRDSGRRMLLDAGEIGEIRRAGGAFAAELRSLAHELDPTVGRRYASRCDARLGDGRCGVDLTGPTRRITVPIVSVVDASTFRIAAPPGFSSGAFAGGTAAIGGGPAQPIMGHARAGAQDVITLWAPPDPPLQAGAAATLTVGCDKTFETCRDRFQNALNFRGFPHIPGNDHVLAYARQGEPGQDGGATAP